VGALRVEGGPPDPGARVRFLPALASLLAVAVERERLEREATAAERLRLSDAVKTAILRAVSHDLRSPLTAIRVAAESVASPAVSLSPVDRARQLETVRHESARLDRLVANLLDLSRLQTAYAEPARELVAAEELVGRALAELGGDERVRTEFPPEPPLVEVDPAQVERVLVNLLENALRYSPPAAEVLVRVSAAREEVAIAVVDRGPGVPPEDAERIFEPFQQLAANDGSRGTGLGLAIVRGFAEANGGRVWAEAAAGGGASFAVAFPRARVLAEVER
jgi:two-component system sensor histidine kinase KdpD